MSNKLKREYEANCKKENIGTGLMHYQCWLETKLEKSRASEIKLVNILKEVQIAYNSNSRYVDQKVQTDVDCSIRKYKNKITGRTK